MNKYPSEILSVTLNEATFHEETVKLAAVNFFFGNNGTGKSTLAKTLQVGNRLNWNPERQPDDYVFHLYDKSFVDDNLRSSSQLAGVFTLDQQNIEVEDQISKASAELTEQRSLRNKANEQQNIIKSTIENLTQATIETCWTKTTTIRKQFPETQEGKKRSKQIFFRAVLIQKTAKEHNLTEIDKLYKIAFDSSAHTHPKITPLNTSLPHTGLTEKPITSSADSSYAQFIKKLGSLDWIEYGHQSYGTSAGDRCPYCAQKLPENFEEKLALSVDETYRTDVASLKEFSTQYKTAVESLLNVPKSNQLPDLLPGLDLTKYDSQIDLLWAKINANIKELEGKIRQPSSIVILEPIEPILADINNLIAEANTAIDEHNTVVNNKRVQQQHCSQSVWEHIAFILDETLDKYEKSKASLESKLKELDTQIKDANTRIHELEQNIDSLTKKTVNTTQTMKTINKLLHDSGFEGFELRENQNKPNVYEVIRPNGEIADQLSEGERNFIAFLYFYFQLQGSLTNTGENKDKIVIIDDPVSSMDAGALFIIAALVRELVNTVLNNWMPATGSNRRDHIKQIFLLTHNAYFFKEATYNRVSDYQHVSYYLIRKQNNQSSILPCIRNRSDAPALQENYSPVTNAYATLWQEYKEVTSSTTLLNVMRRILEHYFLQLCGHDSTDIRNHILKTNRDKFIITKEDGTEDLTDLRQAEAILAYLNHEMTGLGDDTFYIEHTADPDTCRRVFHQIFIHMGQEQHYNMMMQPSSNLEVH